MRYNNNKKKKMIYWLLFDFDYQMDTSLCIKNSAIYKSIFNNQNVQGLINNLKLKILIIINLMVLYYN